MLLDELKFLNAKRTQIHSRKLRGKYLAFYFGAKCKPCDKFTPVLTQFYAEACAATSEFEVVFVSTDVSEAEMYDFLDQHPMPWIRLPFRGKYRQRVLDEFGVAELPTLVIVAPDGSVLSMNGRKEVLATQPGKGGRPPKISVTDLLSKWRADAGDSNPELGAPGAEDYDDNAEASGRGEPSGSRRTKRSSRRRAGSGRGEARGEPAGGKSAAGRSGAGGVAAQTGARGEFVMTWANEKDDRGQITQHQRGKAGLENLDAMTGLTSGNLQPVHIALRDGNLQLFNYLMKRRVEVFVMDASGRTPLHYLAMHGGGTAAKGMLRRFGRNPDWMQQLSVQDNDGNVPLHLMCRYGHGHLIPWALAQAPDAVEVVNNLGRRPYDEMLLMGHMGLLNGLTFEKDQSPSSIFPSDVRAGLAAPDTNSVRETDSPRSKLATAKHQKSCNRALYDAVIAGDAPQVKWLLANTPANPLAKNKDGVTIMDHAISAGAISIMRILDRAANPVPPVNIDNFAWHPDVVAKLPKDRFLDQNDPSAAW
ncbi:thioredoxin 1 [Thecamonas trahens ATCC 50062]|uniref:protein-disulfide reductase n=1 Tax=Thecamonas trahens ATCC 50062 TaxID=461836 RepID=A0A0L0D895_THETB|nr:thioredoxin 1 [Thecamonas trahens ATCC 50062]KNC48572.1 thioredoxin 1 [Thecamonas trahens ATCC 50062]|eukprot:XP_013762628.1 thioredoxin 1 [Thecamonas trahens ATCC 50062]